MFSFSIILVEIRKYNSNQVGFLPNKADLKKYFSTLTSTKHQKIQDKMLFAALMFIITISGLPTTLFEIAAGFIFKWQVLLIAYPAKTIGCFSAFLIGRYFWYDIIHSIISKYQYIHAFESMLRKNELRVTLLLRFIYGPQWIKNYGLSCLNISILNFSIATALVGFLYSLIFTFIGVTSSSIADTVNGTGHYANPLLTSLLVLGCAAAIAGFVWIIIEVRKEIRQSIDQSPNENTTLITKF